MKDAIQRKAYRLLTTDMEQVKRILMLIEVNHSRVAMSWHRWIKICHAWLKRAYDTPIAERNMKITHSKLIDEILPELASMNKTAWLSERAKK